MMATSVGSDRPKFRHDQLLAEPIDERSGKFIDVMDPDSGTAFRFYEVEFSLACAMDGQRDVAGIVQWAKDELGLAPSQTEVRTVIETLGELGYLDVSATAKAAATTRPAGRGAAEDLAAGIVVPQQRPQPVTSVDVELGHAGGFAPKPPADVPRAPELTLGAPGASTVRTPQKYAVEDVALGAPGPASAQPVPQQSDVSLDLADHMGVRPDDVKEAVRASKVMQAVDVPKDLLDSLEDKPLITGAPAMTARPVEPRPMERPIEAPRPVKPAEKPAIVARPVDKPAEKQPVMEKRPSVPVAPEPARRTSGIFVVLLILVVVGAAAYFVWKYVLSTSNDSGEQTSMVVQPAKPPPPKEPPPPPEPVIKLAMDAPPAADVKASAGGIVESIEPGKTFKRDAVVVKLVGNKPIAAELKVLGAQVERVKGELTKAEADLKAAQDANNAGKVKEAERVIDDRKKSLATKEDTIAKKQADLDKLHIKAPVDGDVDMKAKANVKLAEGDLVFSIVPAPTLRATFPKAGDTKVDTNVFVAVKGTEQKLTCRVTKVSGTAATVACPADAALTDKAVTLAGPAPDVAPDDKIEMTPPTPTPTPTPTPPPPQPKQQPKLPPKPPEKPPEKPADKPAETPPPPAGGSATP